MKMMMKNQMPPMKKGAAPFKPCSGCKSGAKCKAAGKCMGKGK